jgi:hypothetical protein
MALIPKFHTAVAMFPVDPADVTLINAGSSDATYGIYAGQVVGLTSAGYVKHATASNASPTILPIGMAGDSLAVSAGHTAYQDSILVSAGGSKKSTQNRVTDYFNETLGSGLLTVYITGGEFYTDMFLSTDTFTVGAKVYANPTAAYTTANAGLVTCSTTSNASQIGVLTTGITQFPSGVPGVDSGQSGDYSMALKSYNGTGFISFVMQL